MPLYEYFCLDCRQRFDAIRKILQADEPIRCHHCEGESTTRALALIAAPVRGASEGSGQPMGGGGCCGGSCGCSH
jgi:putative FmdB family regulatory protein